MIKLGHVYKDKITGYRGVCTGYVQYITGCNQALLAAQNIGDEALRSEWIDEQRLELVDAPAIVLDNSKGAGSDKAAPKR
jgi:hypothetical protein